MTVSAAIVVPTRDRSDLAIEAVRSLLALSDPRLRHVIVSDNSSQPDHVKRLADFCERTADSRLLRLRPATALPMAEHWDWAAQETLRRSEVTHVALHYDRRISNLELPRLFDVAAGRPDVPVTYLIDVIYSYRSRYYVRQMPWSGAAYEIRTSRAVKLASRGLLTDLWQSFPVLVNCITPRSVFERVRDRFGDICASTSPESCFGFRCSAVIDSYLHFDRPLGIHYGSARSNGLGYLRGDNSGTFGDFLSLRGDRPWLDSAPIPGVSLGQNSFYHEYGRVQREVGKARFPPIERPGYLADLARGLVWIEDPVRQTHMRELLASQGWQEDTPDAAVAPRRTSIGGRLREKMACARADHVRARPSDLSTRGVKKEAVALRLAKQHPRPAVAENELLTDLEPVRQQ